MRRPGWGFSLYCMAIFYLRVSSRPEYHLFKSCLQAMSELLHLWEERTWTSMQLPVGNFSFPEVPCLSFSSKEIMVQMYYLFGHNLHVIANVDCMTKLLLIFEHLLNFPGGLGLQMYTTVAFHWKHANTTKTLKPKSIFHSQSTLHLIACANTDSRHNNSSDTSYFSEVSLL